MSKKKVIEEVYNEEGNKEKILKTAIELFSKHGYEKTSIRDITRKSGISTGSLYFHFRNKKDILKEMFVRLKPSFGNIDEKFGSRLSFREYFKLLGKNMLDYILANLGFHLLLINEGFKDPELSVFFYEQFDGDVSIISKKLSEYSINEDLRNSDHKKTTISLLSSVLSLALLHGTFKENLDRGFLDDMLEHVIDVHINWLVRKNQ